MYLGSDALVLMALAASGHLASYAFYFLFPYFSIGRATLAGELEEIFFHLWPKPLLTALRLNSIRASCETIIKGQIVHKHTIIITIIIIYVMELGQLLTLSGITYPEIPSKVYHDSFCQLWSSVSLPWVIYFEVFYNNNNDNTL